MLNKDTGSLPQKIMHLLVTDSKNKSLKNHQYNTRNKNKLNFPKIKHKTYRSSFLYQSNKEYLLLPKEITTLPSYSSFIETLKNALLDTTDKKD